MNKVELNDWLQILGMLGVIASLIFVGLQMRQSQQIALAGQVQARAEMLTNRSLALMEGEAEAVYSVLSQSAQSLEFQVPISELSDREIFQINNQLAWSVGIMTNTFYQYNAGFLDEEQYIVFQKRVAQFRQNCAFRTQINQTLFFAEQSFVDYWDSLPENCEPE